MREWGTMKSGESVKRGGLWKRGGFEDGGRERRLNSIYRNEDLYIAVGGELCIDPVAH